jgi:hypothetical protein
MGMPNNCRSRGTCPVKITLVKFTHADRRKVQSINKRMPKVENGALYTVDFRDGGMIYWAAVFCSCVPLEAQKRVAALAHEGSPVTDANQRGAASAYALRKFAQFINYDVEEVDVPPSN